MNAPKVSDEDYINFVIATPRAVSATEAARVQPEDEQAPAHDAFTRLRRASPKKFTLKRSTYHLTSPRETPSLAGLIFYRSRRSKGCNKSGNSDSGA